MESVKLYEVFKSKLETMGKVRTAWFTTFNLDVAFFEKYILSAVMNRSAEQMNSVIDFETINEELDEEEMESEKVDVRVFYDYRGLCNNLKQKQTAVSLHPVNPDQVKTDPKAFFDSGLFHAKVAVFETFEGEIYLLTGSANLAVSGWARNRECFFLEKVYSSTNWKNLATFFTSFAGKSLRSHRFLDRLRNKRNTSGKEDNWEFLSSMTHTSPLEVFEHKDQLLLWSPYFSKELSSLVSDIKTLGFDSLKLIPSIKNGKVGFTVDESKSLSKSESVKIELDNHNETVSFSHAKVILGKRQIGLGSWNCTYPGLNMLKTKNNVEAGVVMKISPATFNSILDSVKLMPLKGVSYSSQEELTSETEDLVEHFTACVELLVDWKAYTVSLINGSVNELRQQIKWIVLPGIGKVDIGKLSTEYNFRSHYKSFLSDKLFVAENEGGEIVFKGYFQETNISLRPTRRFEDLGDMFKGWLNGKPEQETNLHKSNLPRTDEVGDEVSDRMLDILNTEGENPYFTSFQAFRFIKYRLENLVSSTTKEKRKEIHRLAFSIPGSLNELKEHLSSLIALYHKDRSVFKKSPVYLWFMIEKANELFKIYNNHPFNDSEKIQGLRNIELNSVIKNSNSQLKEDQVLAWTKYVSNKLSSK